MNPDETPTPAPVEPASSTDADQPKSSNKKLLLAAAGVLVIVVAVVIGVVATHHKSGGTDSGLSDSKNPDNISGIAVGPYRYVNACQALPAAQEQYTFALLATTAEFKGVYADDGLPVKDIPSDGVQSSCYRQFGTDTNYAGVVVTFTVSQFPTTQAAQAKYKEDSPQGSLNTDNVAPLPGAKNTVYNPTMNSSYTLLGNKILNFTAGLGYGASTSPDTFRASILKALPQVEANIANPKLPQQFNVDTDFGRKIGDSTYADTCKLYTGSDFQKATGLAPDPTRVTKQYQYAAPDYLATDTFEGSADDSCERVSMPNQADGKSLQVQTDFFKSSGEANAQIQQNLAGLAGEEGLKGEQVNGVGDFAYYETSTDGAGTPSFYVQKGPYILELNMYLIGSNNVPSQADYTKAANVLLPKLPQ